MTKAHQMAGHVRLGLNSISRLQSSVRALTADESGVTVNHKGTLRAALFMQIITDTPYSVKLKFVISPSTPVGRSSCLRRVDGFSFLETTTKEKPTCGRRSAAV